MAEPSAPKTRSAQGTSRAKLIDAALELFATRPYGEVTVGEVALVAGVAHGLLFHYFDSKRGLYLAALEEAAHQLLVAHQTDPSAPPGARIRQLLRSHLDHMAANEHLALNLILRGTGGGDPAAHEVFESSRWEMTDWVCGQLRLDPSRPAIQLALRSFARGADEITDQWLSSGRRISVDNLVRGLVELLVGALVAATEWDPELGADQSVAHAVAELRRDHPG